MREAESLRAAITKALGAASKPEDLGELFTLLGELDAGINEVATRLNTPVESGEFWSVARIAEHTPVSPQAIWGRITKYVDGEVPRTVR